MNIIELSLVACPSRAASSFDTHPLHLFSPSLLTTPSTHATSISRFDIAKMSFTIEVPGDANPLTLQELCKALEAATSMDNSQRQAAGKQLNTWETQQGYFPSLQVCLRLAGMAYGPRYRTETRR